MDNEITIGNGTFEVSRFYGANKNISQVVKEKVLDKIKNTDILTKDDKKSYNN